MRPGLDPRVQVPSAALALLRAGADPDAEAVRAARAAPGPRTRPDPPAVPRKPGRSPHSPVTAVERAARVEAARLHYSLDVIPDVMWRIRQARGMAADEPFEVRRHPFEHPGCASCDRGFVEVGGRAVPCPVCRAGGVRGAERVGGVSAGREETHR